MPEEAPEKQRNQLTDRQKRVLQDQLAADLPALRGAKTTRKDYLASLTLALPEDPKKEPYRVTPANLAGALAAISKQWPGDEPDPTDQERLDDHQRRIENLEAKDQALCDDIARMRAQIEQLVRDTSEARSSRKAGSHQASLRDRIDVTG